MMEDGRDFFAEMTMLCLSTRQVFPCCNRDVTYAYTEKINSSVMHVHFMLIVCIHCTVTVMCGRLS